jgi:uncharacterized protein YuzE
MRWELDSDAGSLYVRLSEQSATQQHVMPDGVVVDVDADSGLVGIEIVSVWAPFNLAHVVDRYDLDEADVASLIMVTTMLSQAWARPDRLDVVPGGTSSAPAEVFAA